MSSPFSTPLRTSALSPLWPSSQAGLLIWVLVMAQKLFCAFDYVVHWHLLKLQFALLTSITGTCQKYFICLHIYCSKTYTWTGLKISRCCQDSPLQQLFWETFSMLAGYKQKMLFSEGVGRSSSVTSILIAWELLVLNGVLLTAFLPRYPVGF